MLSGVLLNKKGSGIAVIIGAIIVILVMVATISGTLHNKIILSHQMRINDALESATRAAMKCIDIEDDENLERISKGIGEMGENYISLDLDVAYPKFVEVVAMGIPDPVDFPGSPEFEKDVRNHLIFIYIEPVGKDEFNMSVIWHDKNGNQILEESESIRITNLQNEINEKINEIINNSNEGSSEDNTVRVDINVILSDIISLTESEGQPGIIKLFENILKDNEEDTLKNTFIISVLYDYELNGIFPIIDVKNGIVTKRKYTTGTYGVIRHIRKVWE